MLALDPSACSRTIRKFRHNGRQVRYHVSELVYLSGFLSISACPQPDIALMLRISKADTAEMFLPRLPYIPICSQYIPCCLSCCYVAYKLRLCALELISRSPTQHCFHAALRKQFTATFSFLCPRFN